MPQQNDGWKGSRVFPSSAVGLSTVIYFGIFLFYVVKVDKSFLLEEKNVLKWFVGEIGSKGKRG